MKLAFLTFLFFGTLNSDAFAFQVLIFGKTIRPAHEALIPITGNLLKNFFTKNGFKSDFTQDTSEVSKENLNKYQTLILLDVSEGVFSDQQKKIIETYVKHGGGLLAIHASISAGKDWPWFKDKIGTLFLDHPPLQDAQVQLVDQNLKWTQNDEWYNLNNPLSSKQKIIAVIDEASYKGGKMGLHHPVTWRSVTKNEKVWYTAMGHSPELYASSTPFMLHLLEGLRWTTHSSAVLNP